MLNTPIFVYKGFHDLLLTSIGQSQFDIVRQRSVAAICQIDRWRGNSTDLVDYLIIVECFRLRNGHSLLTLIRWGAVVPTGHHGLHGTSHIRTHRLGRLLLVGLHHRFVRCFVPPVDSEFLLPIWLLQKLREIVRSRVDAIPGVDHGILRADQIVHLLKVHSFVNRFSRLVKVLRGRVFFACLNFDAFSLARIRGLAVWPGVMRVRKRMVLEFGGLD